MRYTIFFLFTLSLIVSGCGPEKKETSETILTVDEKSKMEEEQQLFMVDYAEQVNQGLIPVDTFKGSARREAHGMVGPAHITINYGSPGVRGRVIWNGLVSYDQVWVSGSHWATAVEISTDIKVQDTEVPAGTYGFYTIPGKEEWTLILNKVYDSHLAEEYKENNDVVRVTVTPEILEDPVQRLTYAIEGEGDSGAIVMSWEKIKVGMPFKLSN